MLAHLSLLSSKPTPLHFLAPSPAFHTLTLFLPFVSLIPAKTLLLFPPSSSSWLVQRNKTAAIQINIYAKDQESSCRHTALFLHHTTLLSISSSCSLQHHESTTYSSISPNAFFHPCPHGNSTQRSSLYYTSSRRPLLPLSCMLHSSKSTQPLCISPIHPR